MINISRICAEYLSSFVYGAIDGTVGTFATITAAKGASLSPTTALAMGLANVFSDGFTMGASSYLSEKTSQLQDNQTTKNPIFGAIITCLSFIMIGLCPLLIFLFIVIYPKQKIIHHKHLYLISFFVSMICLFLIGAIKGRLTNKSAFYSGCETLIVGGVAALISYLVGFYIQKILK
jgi:VIT1/CCC1 family predicted Fe2+/Mn2+ transporter